MKESSSIEKKSLRVVIGNSSNYPELAKDCVCMANSRGGIIYIGLEDDESEPHPTQNIPTDLPNKIQKRIAELTVNVATHPEIIVSENGGQYIKLIVHQSKATIASTTDGRYYYRLSDECKPLPPEELTRLLTDKPAFMWETKVLKNVKRSSIDINKLEKFVKEISESERVTQFVKEKSADELLDYYLMADGDNLTNLGVLWVGKREDRAKLLYSPIVQFLKYDEAGNRVNKIVWDDYELNPKELIEAIWTQIPDWKEGIEVSDGIFRKFVPNYEEEIIRELVANALVHRPYTTRGDIFISLYPDRLEVHNPGLFPIGVTPENILHKSVKRNEHLAKVFYDLKLMEREGTGYDKMYEILLSNGKQVPIPKEGDDRVFVTIKKQIIKSETITLVNRANEEFQLRQKETICLALIAQHNCLSAIEFSNLLNLPQQISLRDWMGRLLDLELIKSKGKTKGVEYFVNPEFLRKANFKGKTNLKRIEVHRLKELIFEDLKTYPGSSISEINQRIGIEIPNRRVKLQLDKMEAEGLIKSDGIKRWTRYSINKN